jgi:hypothetical protein
VLPGEAEQLLEMMKQGDGQAAELLEQQGLGIISSGEALDVGLSPAG